jgi:phage gpG-like protein
MELDEQKILAKANEIAAMRLEACAIHLVNRCRENLSKAGRTKKLVTISRGKNKGKQKTAWGPLNSAPSKPGDFPARQTGALRSSIAYDVDRQNLTARVGTALKYGRWLEFGTRRMAPRPWLLRTLKEEGPKLSQIMATGKTS